MPTAYPIRRLRRGVSLVEMSVVVAIIGIMAGTATWYMEPLVPQWRTRQAANDLGASIMEARSSAIVNGNRYRVSLPTIDPGLMDSNENIGIWTVAAANPDSYVVEWDVLPLEDDDVDDLQEEGTFDLSPASPRQMLGVSIAGRDMAAEPYPDLVFDTRGFLTNPSSDFDADGVIIITIANKKARARSDTIRDYHVAVNRAGGVRVYPAALAQTGNGSGTMEATTIEAASGAGWTGTTSSDPN